MLKKITLGLSIALVSLAGLGGVVTSTPVEASPTYTRTLAEDPEALSRCSAACSQQFRIAQHSCTYGGNGGSGVNEACMHYARNEHTACQLGCAYAYGGGY